MPVNKEYWIKKASWSVEAAEALIQVTANVLPTSAISFVKHYISIVVGKNNYFYLHKRSGNMSLVGFRIASHLADEAQTILDAAKISFNKKSKEITMIMDAPGINQHKAVFAKLAELTAKTWEK